MWPGNPGLVEGSGWTWMDLDRALMLDPRLGTAHPQEGQEAAEGAWLGKVMESE